MPSARAIFLFFLLLTSPLISLVAVVSIEHTVGLTQVSLSARENYRCTKFSLGLYELRRRRRQRKCEWGKEGKAGWVRRQSIWRACVEKVGAEKEINVSCKKKSAQTQSCSMSCGTANVPKLVLVQYLWNIVAKCHNANNNQITK